MMKPSPLRRLVWAVIGCADTQPRCGHRITYPANRTQAIRTWRRAANVWINSRFAEDQVTAWKPATTERVVRFGRR